MSIYQSVAKLGPKLMSRAKLFRLGFNLSPMYRRSTAKIVSVSPDLLEVKIRLPINYKNRNYVNSIFGGSMFSAVDPIPMVQLINLLDSQYVVWDKSAEIKFKRPAREPLFAEFTYTEQELQDIKAQIETDQEMELEKLTRLTSKDGSVTYCEVKKTIYIADKAFYKQKKAQNK
ncbi:MAG: DUF4442 domain-containing protein [Bacteroidota bacterium]